MREKSCSLEEAMKSLKSSYEVPDSSLSVTREVEIETEDADDEDDEELAE